MVIRVFPQQHPWSGTDCLYDKTSNKWVIDGLDLDNQGLRGFLPNEISHLRHLQSINLSGNSIKGPIPSALGLVTTLEKLDVCSFTDNAGLCGIPGLRTCGPHLSVGAKVGIGFGVLVALLLIATCLTCWWKRRQNILRAQRIAARDAPYAKARTHFSRDVQMARHHGHEKQSKHSNSCRKWTSPVNLIKLVLKSQMQFTESVHFCPRTICIFGKYAIKFSDIKNTAHFHRCREDRVTALLVTALNVFAVWCGGFSISS
nr:putative leucine-rich repeat receptor-like serine/threonine-protein kinase At2g14440 [Ipomoea batatas]